MSGVTQTHEAAHGRPTKVFDSPIRRQERPHRTSPTAVWVSVAMGLCILEGIGRKWFFPGSGLAVQAIFYFAKDMAFLIAALTALRHRARTPALHQVKKWLALAGGLIIMASLVSFSDATLVGGALTLRALVVLPYLAFLIAPGLRSVKDLELIVKTTACLAVGVAVLAGIQYYYPSGHFLNQQVDLSGTPVQFLGRVRASGTFTFITGMSNLALAATWAGVCLLFLSSRRWLGYFVIIAGLACASAAMSRVGLLFSLALCGACLLLTRAGFKSAISLLVLIGSLWYVTSTGPNSHSDPSLSAGGVVRYQKAGDLFSDRALMGVRDMLDASMRSPLGNGIGLGQFGQQAAVGDAMEFAGYESELGRIVYEMGVLGLVAVIVFRLVFILKLWKVYRHMTRELSPYGPICYASMVACFLFLAVNTCFDHVASTFCWIIAAVGMATVEIESRRKGAGYEAFVDDV